MRKLFLLLSLSTLLLAESAGGLSWTMPAGWTSKGATSMRAAQYQAGDAECVVYFFGAGQGGGVDANIARWAGQFTLAGKPALPKTTKKKVNGKVVTEQLLIDSADHVYESTAAHGGTIFWKQSSHYLNVTKSKEWL